MASNNINKYQSIPLDIPKFNETLSNVEAADKEDFKRKTISPDPKTLKDSLEAKRQLIYLLEKGGYIKGHDFEQLKIEMNKAIEELDSIIKLLNE